MNIIEREDADYIASCDCVRWEALEGKRVFITGGTGLIGQTLVRGILSYNDRAEHPVHIVLLVRSREKAEKLFKKYVGETWFELTIGDVLSPVMYNKKVDYIIHGASITSSREFVEQPVETIMTAIQGTRNILEFARNNGILGMVYLSSMEIYGKPVDEKPLTEERIGYLDPLAVRSSYSESKRMVENLCVAYWKEFGVPVKIVRLTQTIGPGVLKQDNRVFAYFGRCVLNGEDICLLTEGKTRRMYIYSADAATAILTVLTKGDSGTAYNAANKNTYISIRDMAMLVAQQFGKGSVNVTFVKQAEDVKKFNPEMNILLDVSRLEQLGWKAVTALEKMYERMIAGMEMNG